MGHLLVNSSRPHAFSGLTLLSILTIGLNSNPLQNSCQGYSLQLETDLLNQLVALEILEGIGIFPSIELQHFIFFIKNFWLLANFARLSVFQSSFRL